MYLQMLQMQEVELLVEAIYSHLKNKRNACP